MYLLSKINNADSNRSIAHRHLCLYSKVYLCCRLIFVVFNRIFSIPYRSSMNGIDIIKSSEAVHGVGSVIWLQEPVVTSPVTFSTEKKDIKSDEINTIIGLIENLLVSNAAATFGVKPKVNGTDKPQKAVKRPWFNSEC